MRAYVPTPAGVVDLMVEKLFAGRPPTSGTRLLDPGCGDGAFIDGVLRWCGRHGHAFPEIVGVELEPGRAADAEQKYDGIPQITILPHDFLLADLGPFDYIVGNPPYVAISEMGDEEKVRYREFFQTAEGRFDLYFLFWEMALSLLSPTGRMVFITPEKYLTVRAAQPLRALLARRHVPEVHLLPENTFPGLTTYPAVTTVDAAPASAPTHFLNRNNETKEFRFTLDGASLAVSLYADGPVVSGDRTLSEIAARISCGVATGADKLFVQPTAEISPLLQDFAHPTISGRQLAALESETVAPTDSMLVPYGRDGQLMPFEFLHGFGTYLESHKERLLQRTCVKKKPWYAFHENPPMPALLQPKILCRDITAIPRFWVDVQGDIVPRHSVYYIVLKDASKLEAVAAYLNSPEVINWLNAHCQRAANGFLRVQSTALKRLPIPADL